MTRTPKLSTNMLNSGVARWRGRKRALKRVQTLISGVVVVVAGRRWAKPQKRAVVLAFRAGGVLVVETEKTIVFGVGAVSLGQ